ncbi:MAG TPA: riboflavin kinase, partial [Tepidisphaeraceae bacterium]|nr:riboflavin kinase [Tepidisphaeraceae bacterium]
GKGRGGTVDRLREWSSAAGVGLTVASPAEAVLTDLAVAPVSSSLVRWLLGHGRARDAAICLGRPYGLRGEVVRGFQRGRTIDVPTANLGCGDQLIPLDGVYAGRCEVDGVDYPAALSIGDLPTFAERAHQVEAHLIGFKGDLYGRTIEVRVTDWLREQWKFDGLEPLKAQIARDLSRTRELFGREPARELARV